MNRHEAQFILQAYRPGGEDASDPRFQESLGLVQRDPELARWFANEQALDARISAKLRASLRAPAHLKSQLLVQSKLLRPASWRRAAVLRRFALAACVMGLITLSAFWFHSGRDRDFASYREAMATLLDRRLDRLDFVSRDVAAVRGWLAERGAHGDLVLPAGLNGRPSLGCRLLEWRGRQVSLICFELENRKVAHLLVADASAFQDSPAASPVLAQADGVATVSWSHGSKTYVLASKDASPAELIQLL